MGIRGDQWVEGELFFSEDGWVMEGFFRDISRRRQGHGRGLEWVGRLVDGPLEPRGCRWKQLAVEVRS